MTFGAWRSIVLVVYLDTTPNHAPPGPSEHGKPHGPSRFPNAPAGLRAAVAVLVLAAALAGCKGGAGAPPVPQDPAADATPVEVAAATRRAIAASYTGTAPLEPRAESQVVAKTSGVALEVLVEEGQQVRAG